MTNASKEKKYAMALGTFDGLHRAHMMVLDEVLGLSERGFVPSVLLFDEHPRKVLFGENVKSVLQKDKRDEMLKEMGFEIFFVSFAEIMNMSPEEFVDEILVKRFNVGAVVSGFNYRFGKNAVGNSLCLQEECEKRGISASTLVRVDLLGEAVSSTRIRNAVENGDIELADELLGFPFCFRSPVFYGDGRGHGLGTPTVNQLLPDGLVVPKKGVYASKVKIDGREYEAVTDIGCRPTFNGEQERSETYIFDFNGDLYGKTIEVRLYKFVREERKFPDPESLKKQISLDIADTLEFFSKMKEKNEKKL